MGQVVALRRGQMLHGRAVREIINRPRPLGREINWFALLQRTAAGDQSAVAELYDATSPLVFGLALRIVSERAAAEDVVIEVYAQVWSQAKTYDPQRGTPLCWLLTLTRSRAIDLLRVRNRTQGVEPLEATSDIQAATPDPEETSLVAERRRVVCKALESLSEEQRQAIELAYFADLSHSEIATKLGQPLGTVKTRIRVGLMRLREVLGPSFASPTAAVNQGRQQMIREHSIEEGRDLAALYALGMLRGEAAREFEQHLAEGCSTCAAEVEAFAPVVAELGHVALPQTPRPELRARVLERVVAEGLSTDHPVIDKEGVRFVRSAGLDWQKGNAPAVEIKTLSVDPQRGYITYLVRMAPEANLRPHRHADVEESYLLEGDLLLDGIQMQRGDYCRAEPGSAHLGVTTKGGCVFIAVCSVRDELLA